jgi:hypothetical protein
MNTYLSASPGELELRSIAGRSSDRSERRRWKEWGVSAEEFTDERCHSGVFCARNPTNVSGGRRTSLQAGWLGSADIPGRRWRWGWGVSYERP